MKASEEFGEVTEKLKFEVVGNPVEMKQSMKADNYAQAKELAVYADGTLEFNSLRNSIEDFDGVITDEPPPYYFVLSKPSTKLKHPENRSFDRINDAEIVIVDLTTGIRDTLQNAKLTGYQDFRFYDHYRDKDVTVYMKWLPGETPGGLYVTNKIYGVENHTYELHIKYKGKEYTACERMVPKTPIDKIVMKRIDTGEGEPNETPCISFYNPPEEHNYYLLKTDFCSSKVLRVASVYNLYYGTTSLPVTQSTR